jgi:hypothetical protein
MATCSSTLFAASLANRFKAVRLRYRKRLERCRRKFSQKAVPDLRIEARLDRCAGFSSQPNQK